MTGLRGIYGQGGDEGIVEETSFRWGHGQGVMFSEGFCIEIELQTLLSDIEPLGIVGIVITTSEEFT
jgi:hypothetical protein